MPNYCNNYLHITGDEKSISDFKKKSTEKKDKFLETFYPLPTNIDMNESGAFPAWYEWRVENWGTKWDIHPSLDEESPTHLTYSFESAWSPPVAALEYISNDYPGLSFFIKFEENGNNFIGYAKLEKGECIESQEADYNVQAGFNTEIENSFFKDDTLHIDIKVTYKKDKWDFQASELHSSIIEIKIKSNENTFQFNNISKYKTELIGLENINNSNFQDMFCDDLEYYLGSQIDVIKSMVEKNQIETSLNTLELKQTQKITFKI